MSSRPRRGGNAWVLATGLAMGGLYLALAAVSGHLSLLARRPILDSFSAPPPYRWVEPPPGLARTNKRPLPGAFTLSLAPRTGSEPGVFSTRDLQVSLVLESGAFPPQPGQVSVGLTIAPLGPSGFTRPAGLSITGNVYRLLARYRPSGRAVIRLAKSGQLALAYPAQATVSSHRLLFSPDGRAWSRAQSIDSVAQLQVSANVDRLGLFSVGATPTSAPASGRSVGRLIATIAAGVAVGAVIVLLIRAEIRFRRQRARGRRRGGR